MQTEGHAMTRKQSIYSSLELCKSSSFLLLYLFSPLPFNTVSFSSFNPSINQSLDSKGIILSKNNQREERMNVYLTENVIQQELCV